MFLSVLEIMLSFPHCKSNIIQEHLGSIWEIWRKQMGKYTAV